MSDALERRVAQIQRENAAIIKNSTSGSADTREAQLKTKAVQAKLASQGFNFNITPLDPPTDAQDNPLFIYPGDTFVNLGSKKRAPERVKMQRGYIRRLKEFYDKMENAPTIFNRRCNFQFQPDTIVRSVAANAYETQFFFNQEPAQLSVPIPGQASYSFKLLFNREAELVSKKFRSGSGLKDVNVGAIVNRLNNDPEYFINNQYDPSWVCGLGVLADIMVLDAVVGQGFNQEMLNMVKQTLNARAANPPAADPSTADDQDKENTETVTTPTWNWSDQSLNPNLGNTAFITPVPIRVVLSKWMIVEGFITSMNVNFHKFTKDYIPSQASVEVQMQALYIGFDKKQTMLTATIPVSGTPASGTPDSVGPTEKNAIVLGQTNDGINSFFYSATDQGFVISGVPFKDRDSLNNIVFENSQQNFAFKMDLKETVAGQKFRESYEGGSNASGGEVKFFYDAVIKVYWHKYAKNANQNNPDTARTTQSGKYSPAGSEMTLIKYDDSSSEGFPTELTNLKGWGTKKNPFIISSSGEIQIQKSIGVGPIRLEGIKWTTENTGWTFVRPMYQGRVIVPYDDEEFKVELIMRIQATRFGAGYKSPQVVKGSWTLRSDKDDLFNNLSISNSGWPENL